jgi:Tol biopolymer transport system component
MKTTISAKSVATASVMAFSCIAFAPDGTSAAAPMSAVAGAGPQGNSASTMGLGLRYRASLSGDGRFAVFESYANNLVADDTNSAYDVFVRDLTRDTTIRVSVDSSGVQGNGHSSRATISADGRYVAFSSTASNLVAGDTNAKADVFLHDLKQGSTVRVSVDSDGLQSNGNSLDSALSADGSVIVFTSGASNLYPLDGNDTWDVYRHDRISGATTLVSKTTGGTSGNGDSGSPAISANGEVVVFCSDASDLIPGDTNAQSDIFYTTQGKSLKTLMSASVAKSGAQGNAHSIDPDVSDDGSRIVFMSAADNFVSGDSNQTYDIFVHNTATAATSLVSASATGVHADDASFGPAISGDGSKVSFFSLAHNLVDNDATFFQTDVYVKTLASAAIEVASVGSNRVQGSNDNQSSSLSANGTQIVFESGSSNLVSDDSNGFTDIFARNLITGVTRRISVPTTSPTR